MNTFDPNKSNTNPNPSQNRGSNQGKPSTPYSTVQPTTAGKGGKQGKQKGGKGDKGCGTC